MQRKTCAVIPVVKHTWKTSWHLPAMARAAGKGPAPAGVKLWLVICIFPLLLSVNTTSCQLAMCVRSNNPLQIFTSLLITSFQCTRALLHFFPPQIYLSFGFVTNLLCSQIRASSFLKASGFFFQTQVKSEENKTLVERSLFFLTRLRT